MRGGHLYLVAIMDWASRFVLSWELDNTLEAGFCVRALEDALERYGTLVSNTDQGRQFTSEAYLRPLRAACVRISMDGRGRWIDKRFIERLWRSLKHEAVYLEELGRRPTRASRDRLVAGPLQPPAAPLGAGRRPQSEAYFASANGQQRK